MTIEEYNNTVEKYADNLYRFVLKNTGDIELANDVVQESFEKLWLKLETVDGRKVKSYLFTTGYHCMLDQLKIKNRHTDFVMDDENGSQSGDHYSDLSEILEDALDRLTVIQRTVVLLRDYEGYTYDEIGKITNLSEAQVKVYIYRARINLRNYLVKMENII